MQNNSSQVDPVKEVSAVTSRDADSPYLLSPQELRDLEEVVAELKGAAGGDQSIRTSVDRVLSEENASGNLSKVTHAVAANEVREAAANAAQAGRLDLARELEHLAEMIESGQVILG